MLDDGSGSRPCPCLRIPGRVARPAAGIRADAYDGRLRERAHDLPRRRSRAAKREGGIQLPHDRRSDLPDRVRNGLPEHARELCEEAFDSGRDPHADPDLRRDGAPREATAPRVAGPAVEERYRRDEDGRWVEQGRRSPRRAEGRPGKGRPSASRWGPQGPGARQGVRARGGLGASEIGSLRGSSSTAAPQRCITSSATLARYRCS